MNWDAIGAVGEILGAIAVFATLLYLATQIKNMKVAVDAEVLGRVQDEYNFLFQQMLDYADLLAKADSGADLSDAEAMKINLLYRAHMSQSIHAFARNATIGADTSLAPKSFSEEIMAHPAFMRLWQNDEEPTERVVRSWRRRVQGFVDGEKS